MKKPILPHPSISSAAAQEKEEGTPSCYFCDPHPNPPARSTYEQKHRGPPTHRRHHSHGESRSDFLRIKKICICKLSQLSSRKQGIGGGGELYNLIPCLILICLLIDEIAFRFPILQYRLPSTQEAMDDARNQTPPSRHRKQTDAQWGKIK